MNERIWGIVGGIALVLALLSPLVLGNSKKVKRLFEKDEDAQNLNFVVPSNYLKALLRKVR